MVDKIIADIDTSLNNGVFLAALALALTLPDICGKAKYPSKGNGDRYISWYNEFVDGAQKSTDPYAKDLPNLSGEMVFNLRCNFLHQGNPNVEKNKIKDVDCQVDKFILVITSEDKVGGDLQWVSYGQNFDACKRGIKVDIRHLCYIIKKAAKKYYDSNKGLFNFFNYTLIDEREEDRIMHELLKGNKTHE